MNHLKIIVWHRILFGAKPYSNQPSRVMQLMKQALYLQATTAGYFHPKWDYKIYEWHQSFSNFPDCLWLIKRCYCHLEDFKAKFVEASCFTAVISYKTKLSSILRQFSPIRTSLLLALTESGEKKYLKYYDLN